MAAQEVVTETALTIVESMTPAKLFEPGTIDPILERIKSEVRSVVTDISTERGRKEIASLAYKVGRTKTFIDGQRKSLVADEKKRLAAIDKEGKRIWDELESLQHEVRKPLTDWEDAEKERVAAHELCLREIEGAGPFTLQNWQSLPVEAMRDRLNEIKNDARDWQEFSQRAALAKQAAVEQISDAIIKREKYDAEQVELARLRKEAEERAQKEREERIAREAAERAQREAEAKATAERERVEREAREREERERAAKEVAIRAKQEAEARAAKAEADRIAAEKRAEQEKQSAIQRERDRVEAEKKAEADAQAKREANKRHCAKINNEAAAAFLKIGFDEETAKAIVTHIAKGEVPHVSITY